MQVAATSVAWLWLALASGVGILPALGAPLPLGRKNTFVVYAAVARAGFRQRGE